MKLGELFVKLKLAPDGKNPEAINKFRTGLIGLKDKAEDFRKQAQLIAKEKLGEFFKNSEFASLGLVGRFVDLIGKANAVRLAVLAVVGAMVKLTTSAANAAEHLFKFSLNSGMSTTALQRWQMQAEQTGVAAEEVADSLRSLQQRSMDIQMGRGDAGAFQLAGVSWFADAETQLAQIEGMLKSRPAALGTKLAMDMGLSEDMVTFLRLRSTLQPADEGLILSPTEIDELKNFSIDFRSTLAAFQNALKKLGAMILPITRPLMDFARRLLRIGTDIIGWMTAIEARRNVILSMIAAIGAALAIAFFPATITILGIVAAIGAVLLAIEDVASFLRGDDSLTGRGWESLKKGFRLAVDYVKDVWKGMLEWISEKTSAILDVLFAPIKKLQELKDMLSGGAQSAIDSGKGTIESGKQRFENIWDSVKGFFVPQEPALAPTSGMIQSGSVGAMLNQSVNIQVNGAGNPASVAEEVSRKLRQETSNAVYQMPRQEH
jgi:hypothetical protein